MRLRGMAAMSASGVRERETCSASTIMAAFGWPAASTMRRAARASCTWDCGMNSRSADRPYGAAASQNAAKEAVGEFSARFEVRWVVHQNERLQGRVGAGAADRAH